MKTANELRNITIGMRKKLNAPAIQWAKEFVDSHSETVERTALKGFDNITIIINEDTMPSDIRWKYTNKEKQEFVAQEFEKYGFTVKRLTDLHLVKVMWEV